MDGMAKTDIDEIVEPQPSDAQLISQIKKGNRESFDQLVLRHQRRVYGIAYRMTSNHDDADDLAQETFLAVYRALERFDERQSFIAYISRITINLSINHLRRRKRWSKIQSRKQQEANQEMMSERQAGPQRELERKELMDKLARAMETLPPPQKAVLILKAYQEMSYQQIARTLNISMGTVMSRLHRARNRLRAQLKDLDQ